MEFSLLSHKLFTAGRDSRGFVWVEDCPWACSCPSAKCCSGDGSQWHFPEWHQWFLWRVFPSMLVHSLLLSAKTLFSSSNAQMNIDLFYFYYFCINIDQFTFYSGRDKRPVKSLVVGRPILLALEDIDGGPSFLEKALRFLEKYGKPTICSPGNGVVYE